MKLNSSAMRFPLLAVLAVTCVPALAPAQGTRYLTPKQMGGLRIWDANGGFTGQSGPLNISWDYFMAFKNETVYELAEIDVKLSVTENGVEVYSTPAVAITKFGNVGFGSVGTDRKSVV